MCLEDAPLCVCVCGSASVVTKTRNTVGQGAYPRAPGQEGVGSWLWVTPQVSLSDHKVTLILFVWCQLGLLPEWTKRVSFLRMKQKTQTCLQQRRNGFCLRRCWVISVLLCQLSWLLPVWGRQDRDANLHPPDVPEVWGRRSSLTEGAELVLLAGSWGEASQQGTPLGQAVWGCAWGGLCNR